MSWFDEGGNGQPVDVAAMFDSRVPELVGRIVQGGALVSIGTTSDGGSMGITVTLDGRWNRQYFRGSEEAVEWLTGAAEAVETEGRPPKASSGRPRVRRKTG